MGLGGDGDGERGAVGGDLAVDGVGGAGVFEVAVIGDAGFIGGVVLGFVGADVFVDLVDGLQGGGGVE